MRRLTDLYTFELETHSAADASVVVAESGKQVPFAIARMFTITAPAGTVRGRHAHRHCAQLMVCVHGAMDVVCTDGVKEKSFLLNRGNFALLVPPTIWNTVTVRIEGSVLAVLCDRPYEAEDYIRDYQEFLKFRGVART